MKIDKINIDNAYMVYIEIRNSREMLKEFKKVKAKHKAEFCFEFDGKKVEITWKELMKKLKD
ncbi:MAG: hypothetical protein GY861_18230 [bacterium]|nr:hypothetical protein [bacterium]